MTILIAGTDTVFNYLKSVWSNHHCINVTKENHRQFDGDVLVDAMETEEVFPSALPILKEATQATTGKNCHFISLWPGFIEANAWEIGGNENETIHSILERFNKKGIFMEPLKGLTAPRVVSMIVNEGYFTLEDNISNKASIDIAMKLGTGYPMGPFEWSEKIGLERIGKLLLTLSKEDVRYQPSALLLQEAGLS